MTKKKKKETYVLEAAVSIAIKGALREGDDIETVSPRETGKSALIELAPSLPSLLPGRMENTHVTSEPILAL